MEYLEFEPRHLSAVVRITQGEQWPSFAADPERALRVLTAPGTVAVVAVAEGEVVGYARALTDGALTCYLADMAIVPAHRGRGIGRRLVDEVFRRSGAQRMDLLALDEAEGFYQSLPHRRLPGYRIYPQASEA